MSLDASSSSTPSTDISAAASSPVLTSSDATTRAAPAIQPIDRASVHRICSGQVILDLSTAVKELLENSLDAGATTITIALVGHGSVALEVSDNGAGVRPDCYASLALKHWTSKLRSFGDLSHVASFGFRGEALSSLCALADLSVTTRCEGEAMATQLRYNSEGALVEQKPASRTVGTSVSLTNLFSSLPVRHKQFLKRLKSEYAKMLNVVQSYAMVSTGVRIHVYNTPTTAAAAAAAGGTAPAPSLSSRTLVLSTQGSTDMRELITNVFGAKQTAGLQEVNVTLQSNEQFKLGEYFAATTDAASSAAAAAPSASPASAAAASFAAASTPAVAATASSSPSSSSAPSPLPFRLVGFVSRPDAKCGRSAADRQYLYVNGRPVDLSPLCRTITDEYRLCTAHTNFPVFVLNLLLPPGSFDVNLTPNKRMTMLHDEAAIIGLTRAVFKEMYGPTMYTYKVKQLHEFGIQTLSQTSSSASAGGSPSISQSQGEHEDDDMLASSLPSSSEEHKESDVDASPSLSQTLSPTLRAKSASPALPSSSSPQPSHSFSTPEAVTRVMRSAAVTPTSGSTAGESPHMPSSAHSLPNSRRTSNSMAPGSAPPQQQQQHRSLPPSGLGRMGARPPLTQVLQSLPPSNRAPAAYAASLQPLSSPPLPLAPVERHQSTPAVVSSTASGSIRSTNSFLASFARRGSSMASSTTTKPDVPAAVASPVVRADEATMPPPAKRTRTAELSPTSRDLLRSDADFPPLFDDGDGGDLSRVELSRQSTVLLPRSPSPSPAADVTGAFSSSSSPGADSGSPDGEVVIDLLGETDIGVEYRSTAAQRRLPANMDALELFYSNSGADDALNASLTTAHSSLLGRAETVLSPSAASAASVSAASSLGAAPSSLSADGSGTSASRVLSEASMQRVIEKDDFRAMQIIGQFNLGFIITKRNDDLFIIDQHATDEKYRFELLQRTTTLNSQPLLNPLPLDCTPSMQETIREHIDVFRKNGFEIDLPKEEVEEGEEGGAGAGADSNSTSPADRDAVQAAQMSASRARVRVKTLPFSKNVTFGADDIYELCALLSENPHGVVRLPKVTSMFASRACRSAVMIGTALNKAKMENIVHHMADMEHPWACPHGRPTMRHLIDLSQLHAHEEEADQLRRRSSSAMFRSPAPSVADGPRASASPSPCCAH